MQILRGPSLLEKRSRGSIEKVCGTLGAFFRPITRLEFLSRRPSAVSAELVATEVESLTEWSAESLYESESDYGIILAEDAEH